MPIARIIGAGYSGLIAGFAFPQIPIIESAPEPIERHKAVLRFRTDRISALTGVEFRRVNVRKAIWSHGRETAPTVALANQYSIKVLGRVENDRSIWNLEPVERFIAPTDFYFQLVDRMAGRINWNLSWDFTTAYGPVISTVPLPTLIKIKGLHTGLHFASEPIVVERCHVPKCDVFQTIYFPDPELEVFRASITGSMLIMEFRGEPAMDDYRAVAAAFGVDPEMPGTRHNQRYGKIARIADDAARRALLHRLTADHGIYSLGRFATWRNILLDDLPHDCAVIRRIESGGAYAAQLEAAR